MQSQPETRRARDPLVGGLVMVIIGAVLLVAQFYPDLGRYAVLVIGVGLLAVFVVNRAYGALVGGSIVSGVGVGVVLGSSYSGDYAGAAVLVAIGAGFLFILVVSYLLRLRERHMWPLIPGSILVAIGGALALGGDAQNLIAYWPLILIAIGVVLMILAYTRRPSATVHAARVPA